MKKNILVLGLDNFNYQCIKKSPIANKYHVIPFYSFHEVKADGNYPLESLWQKGLERLQDSDRIDGIVGFWDFPVTALQALLCEKLNLHGPTVKSIVKCEHKYWSRLLQQEIIPELIPEFFVLDPLKNLPDIALEKPYWLKPIKSTSSYLSFKIHNDDDLQKALAKIKPQITKIAKPFKMLLDRDDIPKEISHINGNHCIAESCLTGDLCTVEGYVFDNEIHIHGIIASVKDSLGLSFINYHYPFNLTPSLKQKLTDYTQKIITYIGLNNSGFNIEFFYDASENVSLLEINPRVSQSHAYIFEKVDGLANFSIIFDIAANEKPDFKYRQGEYACAGKFFLRSYQDGYVHAIPDRKTIAALEQELPGTIIKINVAPNMRLSNMIEQDSYSYELAHIFTCSDSLDNLNKNFEICKNRLQFAIY